MRMFSLQRLSTSSSIAAAAMDLFMFATPLGLNPSRSRQCFGFVQGDQITGNHISSSGYGPDCESTVLRSLKFQALR